MELHELNKYRYWYDEHGRLWRLTHYCEHPTASFELVSSGPEKGTQEYILNGAIHSMNLSGLKPVEVEGLS